MSQKKIVYFICTGNSCRSQMAEGFARHYGSDVVDVISGGVEAHGVNPKAIEVMAEKGIDISSHKSKLIDESLLFKSDYVVTLCGDARDKCPVLPPSVKSMHWGLEDPAKTTGTDEEIMDAFRKVRDEIERRVKELLDCIREG
ncbi:arsenate reductase (thioredoxin) [Caldanaerobius polysaccharolyticus]|uniref:arsenate reductase (thioredoxin) n=1 Tax=Caldanaerobius polysaccharolyticus TaxID=44256 RepID=UPI00047C8956|nr:arsenate reductase (thioredoxin) [Caldanaerobius polysaccharolyticus]